MSIRVHHFPNSMMTYLTPIGLMTNKTEIKKIIKIIILLLTMKVTIVGNNWIEHFYEPHTNPHITFNPHNLPNNCGD